ncbi:hypothetical protein ACWGAN_17970 [Streptomyces sp. NPDC054945]
MTIAMTERRILHAHWHLPRKDDADLYTQLLAVAEGITPRVQAIEPDAAHLDITGALRYWQRTPEQVAALLRLRTMALHGVQTTCAVAPNRTRRVRGISQYSRAEPAGAVPLRSGICRRFARETTSVQVR